MKKSSKPKQPSDKKEKVTKGHQPPEKTKQPPVNKQAALIKKIGETAISADISETSAIGDTSMDDTPPWDVQNPTRVEVVTKPYQPTERQATKGKTYLTADDFKAAFSRPSALDKLIKSKK